MMGALLGGPQLDRTGLRAQVAGVRGAEGGALLVYQSPEGALRDAPEVLWGPVEPTALLLARLLLERPGLLVLDEPTNHLDVSAVEWLEDTLRAWEGALLIVSHDRAFLDNVVTSSLVFEGQGRVREYVGGYADWLRQRQPPETVSARPAQASATHRVKRAPSGGKLGYLQQRELEQLPEQIEQLEAQLAELHRHMTTPEFYRLPGETITAERQRLASLEADLQDAYRRWEDLECQKPV